MNLREQFNNETKDFAVKYYETESYYNGSYVEWLEQKLLKSEQEKKMVAWEAYNVMLKTWLYVDEYDETKARENFEEWWLRRKEENK